MSFVWPKYSLKEANAVKSVILSNKVKIACSYKEALKLNKFLVKINNYGKTKN